MEFSTRTIDLRLQAATDAITQTLRSRLSPVLLGVLLVSIAAATPAQSLGEIARQYRQEQEAKQKKGEVPVKVFTNDDIARMPPIAILKSSIQAPSSPEAKPSAPAQPPEAAVSGTPTGTPPPASGKAISRKESKEYWQARFRGARDRLAHAIEEQKLVEEELHLLQIQQARELNPERSRKLNGRIDASTVELEGKSVATEKAQRAMDQLEKEFKDSGAPQDWIQKDITTD
jgi:hypothetical protein